MRYSLTRYRVRDMIRPRFNKWSIYVKKNSTALIEEEHYCLTKITSNWVVNTRSECRSMHFSQLHQDDVLRNPGISICKVAYLHRIYQKSTKAITVFSNSCNSFFTLKNPQNRYIWITMKMHSFSKLQSHWFPSTKCDSFLVAFYLFFLRKIKW